MEIPVASISKHHTSHTRTILRLRDNYMPYTLGSSVRSNIDEDIRQRHTPLQSNYRITILIILPVRVRFKALT